MKYPVIIAATVLSICSIHASAATGSATGACEARGLGFDQKEVGWKHQALSKLKKDTVYTLVQDAGHGVVRAEANSSASFYVAGFKPPVAVPSFLSWRWKTDALVTNADNRDKKREDAPLRVLIAFDGDQSTLPEAEQKRFRKAKTLAGRDLPYALLMYIWSDQVAVETIIPSAHTSQVKMLVVAAGTDGLGKWQSVRRNVAADYKRAFGADPGAVTGVGLLTDTDNTGGKAVGHYADIRFECGG